MTQNYLANPRPLHIRSVEVSPDLLLELLKIPVEGVRINNHHLTVTKDAIPHDAKVARCFLTNADNVCFVIYSDSFDAINEGGEVPRIQPMYNIEKIESI